MVSSTRVSIGDHTYQVLLSAELVRSGGRADEGQFVPAVATGGLHRRAFWAFGSPMGQSRSYRDECFTDHAETLDHHYPSVLTNPPLRHELSIRGGPDAQLPIWGDRSRWGDRSLWGGRYVGGELLVELTDDHGSIYVTFGNLSVKLDPLTMEATEYVPLDQPATDALTGQDGRGYLLHGAGGPMQRRNTGTTPHSYAPVTDALGAQVMGHVGVTELFRTFVFDPQTHRLRYTADGFQTLSEPFPIGPADTEPNGLGAWAGFTFAGYDTQLSSFSDAGTVTPLLTTPLRGLRSPLNGSKWAEQWGYLYTITRRGIFQVDARSYALVGLNAIRGFEGPTAGTPVALTAIGESLMACYLGSDGASHIVRGEFNPERPGIPDWYAFETIRGKRVVALETTGLRPQPTLLAVTEDGTVYWWEFGSRAREIADPSYETGELAGAWHGSTLMTEPNRLAVARNIRFQRESGTWDVAVAVDEGAYRDVGVARQERDLGGALALVDLRAQAIVFHTFKPRLACREGGGLLRGILELEYLERPEVVEIRSWTLVLGERATDQWENLQQLVDPLRSRQPVDVETPDGEARKAWVVEVSRTQGLDRNADLPADLVEVSVELW